MERLMTSLLMMLLARTLQLVQLLVHSHWLPHLHSCPISY